MRLPPLDRGIDLAALFAVPQAACAGVPFDGDLYRLVFRSYAAPPACSRELPTAPGMGLPFTGIRLSI